MKRRIILRIVIGEGSGFMQKKKINISSFTLSTWCGTPTDTNIFSSIRCFNFSVFICFLFKFPEKKNRTNFRFYSTHFFIACACVLFFLFSLPLSLFLCCRCSHRAFSKGSLCMSAILISHQCFSPYISSKNIYTTPRHATPHHIT